MLVAVSIAAACVALSVTFRMNDPDIWQHLVVGRTIWQLHTVPQLHLWTWPSYGKPDVLPSWGFRALLWPFWSMGGVTGLFVWRWLTTLVAFGVLWATARRMGARGFSTLAVVVLCALVYRQRSQVRPETLVAVVLAIELWLLEGWRQGGPDRRAWVVGCAWVWANIHISYYLGLVVLGIYTLDAALEDARARRSPVAGKGAAPESRTRAFLWIVPAAVAISFVNPFGARALWQPFEYFLVWRHERIFRDILELHPVTWSANLRNGLPLLVAGWPLLLLWRARRSGLDRVEAALCACFIALGVWTQRFVSMTALVAVPFLARDLDAWIRARRWPAWSAPPWNRAALAAAACVVLAIPEWTRADMPFGLGFEWSRYPIVACDFMQSHDVRGRAFNPFHLGGYLLWRFHPDRSRLPFMDIHQTGTREDRRLAADALTDESAYRALMAAHPFDYVLLDRRHAAERHLLDYMDDDSTWSMVFVDDAAELFVRRHGRHAALADSFGYRLWPAGTTRLTEFDRRWASDSSFHAPAIAELERQVAASPYDALANNALANLLLLDRRYAEARPRLEAAQRLDPALPNLHLRLGVVALVEGRAADAVRELERARAEAPKTFPSDVTLGQAYAKTGDARRARDAYQRALAKDPGNAEALAGLAALGSGAVP